MYNQIYDGAGNAFFSHFFVCARIFITKFSKNFFVITNISEKYEFVAIHLNGSINKNG